ncbi:hypothetical protein N9C88_03495 [Candidatus Pseudothioglobus singularis]|nr:hypothetical protein [Candidatus Pseudothioglobus singularis]
MSQIEILWFGGCILLTILIFFSLSRPLLFNVLKIILFGGVWIFAIYIGMIDYVIEAFS